MSNFEFTRQHTGPLNTHEFCGTNRYRIEGSADGASRWTSLGGYVLVEAENTRMPAGESRTLRIQFHEGRGTWMLEDIRLSHASILPRNDVFGSLKDVMREFKARTGLTPEPVVLKEIGIGISTVSVDGSFVQPNNPWQLQDGSVHQILHRSEPGRRSGQFFVSTLEGRGPQISFIGKDGLVEKESFDAASIFSGEDWLNMEMILPGISQIAERIACRMRG